MQNNYLDNKPISSSNEKISSTTSLRNIKNKYDLSLLQDNDKSQSEKQEKSQHVNDSEVGYASGNNVNEEPFEHNNQVRLNDDAYGNRFLNRNIQSKGKENETDKYEKNNRYEIDYDYDPSFNINSAHYSNLNRENNYKLHEEKENRLFNNKDNDNDNDTDKYKDKDKYKDTKEVTEFSEYERGNVNTIARTTNPIVLEMTTGNYAGTTREDLHTYNYNYNYNYNNNYLNQNTSPPKKISAKKTTSIYSIVSPRSFATSTESVKKHSSHKTNKSRDFSKRSRVEDFVNISSPMKPRHDSYIQSVSSMINEIQMDGFMRIRKEIAEKQKIKQFLETNIEMNKQILNRAKNELHKENLKLSKIAGTTNTPKVIRSSTNNIRSELTLLKKDVDELQLKLSDLVSQTKEANFEKGYLTMRVKELTEEVRALKYKLLEENKQKESMISGITILQKHITILKSRIDDEDKKCEAFVSNINQFVETSIRKDSPMKTSYNRSTIDMDRMESRADK